MSVIEYRIYFRLEKKIHACWVSKLFQNKLAEALPAILPISSGELDQNNISNKIFELNELLTQ